MLSAIKNIILTLYILLLIGCQSNEDQKFRNDRCNIYDITIRLETISDTLKPIRNISLKYLQQGGRIDKNIIRIYNLYWEAPLQYGITIFKPTPDSYLEKFEKHNNIEIPGIYKQFLKEMNGCYIFELSLFGLTPSIYEPDMDYSYSIECYDLAAANREWKYDYKTDSGSFYFGGRTYLYNENIGYFIDSAGVIKAVRYNGQVLNTWTSFSSFLKDEIKQAEDLMIYYMPYDEMEKLGLPVQ
ncbi:MAG: SMI1/KNR4 family protein [Bacteroidales bacterium]|nr:SMI1/KNR4 family protein [Bacteroidales bacterium]